MDEIAKEVWNQTAGWIPVNRGVPTLNEDCIIFHKDKGILLGTYKVYPREWVVCGLTIPFSDITHWQPLPEPPK